MKLEKIEKRLNIKYETGQVHIITGKPMIDLGQALLDIKNLLFTVHHLKSAIEKYKKDLPCEPTKFDKELYKSLKDL